MGIFENTVYLDPKYNYLEKYIHIMHKGFWTPAQYENLIETQDAPYYFNSMSTTDQEAIRRCILAIAIVEDKVKSYWMTLHSDLPQTIIGDVGGVFGNSEVVHRRSYHSLLMALKIDPSEIYDHPETKGRIEYLTKYIEKDPKIIGKKRVLKKLVLFTSLVERLSLFTQFYILMSYANKNRGLKTISALQQSTALEELQHYAFGLDLINIIKEEYPQTWDDYMVELVTKNLEEAYKSEVKLIDWFFGEGVPEHLTREEIVNFLNYNFNTIVKDLKLPSSLLKPVNEEVFNERNMWFLERTKTASEPDFFDNAVGGYSSQTKDIDIDTFQF